MNNIEILNVQNDYVLAGYSNNGLNDDVAD